VRLTLIGLIALVSVAGYLVTNETIYSDTREAAARHAEVESVRTAVLLDRARAYFVGLGNLLADQPVAGPRRFAELVGSTAGSAGLIDALWVQTVPASGRGPYERRLGAPITRLTHSGGFERAPSAGSYLPATYTTGTQAELRAGVDVSGWPALAGRIRDLRTVFAVTASSGTSLGTDSGFYLLESCSFGRGPDSAGYLAVFVPRAWLILSLGDDPRSVAISLDGRSLGGQLRSGPAVGANFQALAQSWRVTVPGAAASAIQSLLPWLALGWPIPVACVAFLVANAVVRRRQAEREGERIFDLSLDMLGIAGLDGLFKRVNPAFERILGYSHDQLLRRPLFDLVHAEDAARTRAAFESLGRGHQLVQFENRNIRSDGSLSWLEWNLRPAPEEGVVYAAARDVTDRRRADEEQSALKRVATLVARGVAPGEVFDAVVAEVGRLFPVDTANLCRYESDGTLTFVATWGIVGERFPVGSRWTLGGQNLGTLVFRTRRPVRIDRYADASGPLSVTGRETGLRSAVGAPIVVEGRLWGMMGAGSTVEQPLPPDTEGRLASFTELVAMAIANAESRAGLARLAEEQAALRRVATLVARGVPPQQVFAAVTEEVGHLLRAEYAGLNRYEPDGVATTILAVWGRTGDPVPRGGNRQTLGGKNLITKVFETGGAARIDTYAAASGPLGVAGRESGLGSGVGTPIVVEGHLWGVVSVYTAPGQRLPEDAEERLASFTELVATAIANAETRGALAASRARIVAAADESRRRIERDLHDGAQQRLVHAVIVLRLATRALARGDADGRELVAEALRHAEQANSELRELAHGILPASLTRGGLRAGVDALVSRVSLPVSVDVSVERLPAGVEATAYFVISEALTNAVKHARAARAEVTAHVEHSTLRIQVRDDGVGGADFAQGSGLVGLSDRVEALGGTLQVSSHPGNGTTLLVEIPLNRRRSAGSPEP
jgi:PAS domain S-box-containing protein